MQLLLDSTDFVNELSKVVVGAGEKFIKVDIKDFFMSGGHSEVVKASLKRLPDGDKKMQSVSCFSGS